MYQRIIHIENSWKDTEIRIIALKSIIWSTFKDVVKNMKKTNALDFNYLCYTNTK